jgi:hypothetical protein
MYVYFLLILHFQFPKLNMEPQILFPEFRIEVC